MAAVMLASTYANAQSPPDQVAPIVVTSQKLNVETLVDRKVYSVTSDVQSTFGTASDVLTAIPSIDIDPDGLISLRGDSNVLILIDGQPSALFSGMSAGDNLQSIPAKDIERIEVITDPPPQYKAQGAAGVINIITRKTHSQGAAGNVQASAGGQGRYELGTALTYGRGPLNASFSATYRQDLKHRLTSSDLVAADAVTGMMSDSKSSINETIHRAVPPVAVTLAYALNEHQTLSVDLARTGRAGLRTYTEASNEFLPLSNLAQATARLSNGHDREIDYDEKLGLAQKLVRPGETLTLTAHHTSSHEVEHYDYINESFLPPAPTFYTFLGFREDRASMEGDADYVLPISRSKELKLGYAFERDDYQYQSGGGDRDASSGADSFNPLLADDFKYRQDIHALYATYQLTWTAWELVGGARAELTETRGQELNDKLTNTERYLQVYPSLHADYHLSEASTVVLGASRRITRPDAATFNPFVDYEYSPNLRAGNATLKPQLTDSAQVGFQRDAHGAAYSATLYYRRNTNGVTDVTQNYGNGLTLTTRANLPRYDSGGVEFTANGRIVHGLSYSLSGDFFYSQIDATALGSTGLKSTAGISGKFKLDYRPTDADSAQLLFSRTDKKLTPQGYVSAINLVNLGYRRSLTADLTAVLTFSDVLNGQRLQRAAVTPSFSEHYERVVWGRVVWLGVTYSFGGSDSKSSKFDYDQSTG